MNQRYSLDIKFSETMKDIGENEAESVHHPELRLEIRGRMKFTFVY